MARLLAFDLGTNFGYAFKDDQGVCFGGHKLKGKEHGERFKEFHHHLTILFNQYVPTVITYELVRRFSSSDAAHVYCGLRAIMLVAAHEFGCDVMNQAPKEIKKKFTGNGEATKEDMIRKCIELGYNIPFPNHKMPNKCAEALQKANRGYMGDIEMCSPKYLDEVYYPAVIPYLDDNIADAVALAHITKV